MEFEQTLKKLNGRINKVGLISRVWSDSEIEGILKDISQELSPTDDILQTIEQNSKIEMLKRVPSIKFYNLHIPHKIVDKIYTPMQLVEYAIKNQNNLQTKELKYIGKLIIKSKDVLALGQFTTTVKKIGKSMYVDVVISQNDPNLMLEVINGVTGEDFNRLQTAILESGNVSAIYRLAQVKGANLQAIKEKIVASEDVDYIYRLAECRNRFGMYVFYKETREELLGEVVKTVLKKDLDKIIRCTNKFKREYADAIAKNFIKICKEPRDTILFSLTTGYGREEATENVAKSGDVKLIYEVLSTIASKEKSKSLYTHNIDLDKLIEGLLLSKVEDLQVYAFKLEQKLTKLQSKIKNKDNLNKLLGILKTNESSKEL